MTELFVVRAESDTALVDEARRIVGYLDRVPGVDVCDVAYSCSFLEGPACLAIVADSVASFRARLASAAERIAAGTVQRIRDKSGTYWFREPLLRAGGKLAFVFPGAMAFYPDMIRDLTVINPTCRAAFDELDEALSQEVTFTPSDFIFPPASCYRRDADIFSSGAYAQALVSTYAGCVALSRLLADCGVVPDGVAGFAGGDLAAMMRSGVVGAKATRVDRLRMIRDIYRIVEKAIDRAGLPETAMVTLLLRHPDEADAVLAALPKGAAELAIDFSPRQKTYAIAPAHEAEAMAAFATAGIRAVKLALNRPFNTPACEAVVPAIRKFADAWIRDDPKCEVYSCALADRVPHRIRKMRAETAERWAKPVRFAETVRKMHADGYRVFLEVGPRGLMTTAIDDTLKKENYAAIALNSIHRRGMLQIQHALAQLAALGGSTDIYRSFMRRGARKLDFDSTIAPQLRREIEMRLSRAFPRLTLPGGSDSLSMVSAMAEPKGRGAKASQRAAVRLASQRRQRQFDFGAVNPLVSDADELPSSPGVAIELSKTFRFADMPFVSDFAIGSSQLSYADPNLKGLVPLSIPVGAEIMAETAMRLSPGSFIVAVENLVRSRGVAFSHGELALRISAERVASGRPDRIAVHVQIRENRAEVAYTAPVMEATFVLGAAAEPPRPVAVEPHARPRAVHWSGREIYPARLCYGHRLRGITFVDTWSEEGLDYEVTVPPQSGNVTCTQFPLWAINPLLLGTVVSGYALWRSHERFSVWNGKQRMDDAYSYPFRLRRLELFGAPPREGTSVRCYLRLMGVTPKTLLSDITVSDGNGGALMVLSGWEEYVEHVRSEYRTLIMQPATSFVTKSVDENLLGEHPGIDVSSAFVTDIPYPVFERSGEEWLKTFAHIVLGAKERDVFEAMTGSAARRTEWLFGRIAAKEAVRRYLKDFHQARWSYADVMLYADDMGKPYAIGEWQDRLDASLDIAIAHTASFVVAVAAANAHVGVDVESISRDLPQEFTAGVFAPDELDLAATSPGPVHAVVRFWCAKEAVSKALGTGIRYSPRELTVSSYDADAGRLTVRLTGAWASAFRPLMGRDIAVSVRTFHGHALAFCFIPDSFFEHEE